MKLNKKGYMLVEIIVSFAIAFAIIIYFTNLIIKFKDVNTDTYYSANFLKNKTLITRNIMEDLQQGKIVEARVSEDNTTIDFEFRIRDNDQFIEEERRLQAIKNNGITKIVYGKIVSDAFVKNDVSYYEKELDPSLIVSSMNIINNDTSIILNIAINSLYSDETYDINFFTEVIDERKLYQIYTLNFDPNGGSVTPTSKDIRYNDFYGELPIPNRPGYTFKRWYDDFYNYKKTITENMVVIEKREQTIKAEWEVKSFTLTFDATGGRCENCGARTIKYNEKYGELPQTERDGYTFRGWHDKDTNILINADDVFQEEKSKILVAHWNANEYEVTFDGNGGTPNSQTMEVIYDSKYNNLPTVTRPGYEFVGWYTASDGGTVITKDTIVKIISNQKLYAHWSDIEYTVTFDGNGGSPATQTKTVNKGGTYENLPIPTRSGYEFVGWYTEASGGTKIETTTNIIENKDHTLYAHWSDIEYTVTFDGNGGSPTTQTKTVTKGKTYETLPTVNRSGYEFVGWYTEASGGTQVTSSTKVTITSDQTLYAQWNPNTYTITFDLGIVDGYVIDDVISPNTKTVTYGETYGELPEINQYFFLGDYVSRMATYPCVTPTNFLGWYTKETGGEQIFSSTIVSITSNQTLYAHWNTYDYCLDISL